MTRAEKGHLSLQPLKTVVTFPYSLLSSGEMGKKKAENYLLYPKLQSKEPEPLQRLAGRAIHPTGTPRPLGPSRSSCGSAGTGQGRRVPGQTPGCVCTCVSVRVCSGCLAASRAWEAQAGG